MDGRTVRHAIQRRKLKARRFLMRPMQRSFALLAGIALVVLTCLSPMGGAYGQTGVDPTQIFQNLSPEQQDALLQQLGAGGLSNLLGGATGAGAGTGQRSNALSGGTGTGLGFTIPGRGNLPGQQLRQQPEDEDEETAGPATNMEGIPILRAEDTIIVEIGFTLPPRPGTLGTPGATAAGTSGLPPGMIPGGAANQLSAAQLLAQGGTGGGVARQTAQAAALQNGQAGGMGMAAGGTQAAPGSDVSYPGEDTPLSEEELQRLKALIDLIRTSNPYKLSRDGVLTLPGFSGIPLAGLTDDQATMRLKVEPAFRSLDVRVTHLPLRKTGIEALKPFGYDLFDHNVATMAPLSTPVPAEYVVGAGDLLQVQLYGGTNRSLTLTVGRDGTVQFPQLGPINVAGLRFSAAKSLIESRVEHEMIGTRASVSMGDTRSIRVFVLGEARRPGSYVVSGLGTITSALYAAGGLRRVGSLRHVQLKRQGALVRELDLYDLLIRGDTTDDAKLLSGDVILIPTIGETVSVAGEVNRPAIYEIKNESSVNDLVKLAGGLTPKADAANAMISRVDEAAHHVVLRANLGTPAAVSGLRNGDLLRVPTLRPTLDNGVVLAGHVFTPGDYAFIPGMHLTDVVKSVNDLQPDADLHYVLIRRELPPDRQVVALSADIGAALAAPGSKADVELRARDRIFVFDQKPGRDQIIKPLLDELKLAGTSTNPTNIVRVDGRVKAAGDYPLEPGMTVSDLIRAGGGLATAAYGGKAELSRYSVVQGQARRMDLINIDLGAALRGDPAQNLKLSPYDSLSVKEVSQWNERQSVELIGEVRFPGRYAVKNGETLRSVIARAGGLTEFAFPEGSVFTREGLRQHEQEQIDMLSERMQADLTVMALQGAAAASVGANSNSAGTLAVGQSLLGQLRSTSAVGRLVINLPQLIRERPGDKDDVVLRDGDRLIVPRFQQQVTVIGEVQSVTSHLYSPGLRRDDYINRSGGLTRRADKGRIYVVHADGSVAANTGARWFEGSAEMRPGDTIVVPMDVERLPALPFWQAVTSILYNVTIAVAAIHSF
jgi:polysaccharide biosynthesis/export protein